MKLSLLNAYARLEKYSDLDLDGRIQSYAKLYLVNFVTSRIHLNSFGLQYNGVDANQYDRDIVTKYLSHKTVT